MRPRRRALPGGIVAVLPVIVAVSAACSAANLNSGSAQPADSAAANSTSAALPTSTAPPHIDDTYCCTGADPIVAGDDAGDPHRFVYGLPCLHSHARERSVRAR